MRRRKLDPWARRRHPHRYSAEDLHAMLLDDLAHRRPLGGPMERGAAFTIGACQKVAGHRRISVDDYFQQLLAEGATKAGTTDVMLA